MEDPNKDKNKRRSNPTRKCKARQEPQQQFTNRDEEEEEEEEEEELYEEEKDSEDDDEDKDEVPMTSFEARSAAAAAAARAKVVLLSKIREWRRAKVLYAEDLLKLPYVSAWLDKKTREDFANADPVVQKQVEAEADNPDTPKLVNTRDFNRGRNSMQCALANYFGFWLKFRGYTPKLKLIWTEALVNEYILWLETYYQPGSTTRNKCWLLKGFLGFLRLRKSNTSPQQLTQIIICKKIFGQAANRNKQVARTDRVLLEEEHYMTNVSNKFMTKEEGAAFFHWCLTQWEEYYTLFLPTDEDQDNNEDEEEDAEARPENLRASALKLQRVMMGMMLYLGGGLRKQVFADLYSHSLKWDDDELVMRVGREKVARVNGSILPLPQQLFIYIKFYKQRVRPHLFADPQHPPVSMWLCIRGRPLHSNNFTIHVKELFFHFNPDLDTTPIDFRRMTITDLFAERLVMEEGETMEHFHSRFSELLNVSVPVMKAHYNRARERNRQTLKTINTDKVTPAATTLLMQMEAKMTGAINESDKVLLHAAPKRKVRDTPDDKEWEAKSGYSPSPHSRNYSKTKTSSGRWTRRKLNFHKKDKEEEEAEAEEELYSAGVDAQLDALDEEWEVQAILGMRPGQHDPKIVEVQVKWRGYTNTTWEPLSEMGNALEALQSFLLKNYCL